MRATLLIFCTFLVIENFVIAHNNDLSNDLMLKNISSKHKKNKEILLNGSKLKKILHNMKQKRSEPRTKKPNGENDYTVFPNQNKFKQLLVDVPSSPYFSGDPHNDEPKLRVKKVLPDFWNAHDRKKRSPETAPEKLSKKTKDETSKATEVKRSVQDSTTQATTIKKVEHANAKVSKSATENSSTSKKSKKPGNDVPVARSKVLSKKPIKRNRVSGSSNNKKSVKDKIVRSNKKSKKQVKRRQAGKVKQSSAKRSNKPLRRGKGGKVAAKTGKESSRRLIAARDALIENYPYVVSIQKDGEHWCTGAILNQRLVITTANCVWKSNRMSRMKIRTGSRNLEHGGQMVNIAEVLKHPGWSIRRNPDYDIALLLTDNFIRFSHSCHAVDLPNRIMMPIFDDAWVVSWGAERRDGIYIKQGLTLQVFHARLIDREKCNNVTMRYGVMVSENFICLEQIGRRAPCTRDTGAPAVSDGVLWGMASWGIRKLCGTERFPAMFSYVASQNNMDFIINGTKWLMSEERLSPFLDRYPFPRVRNYSSRILSPHV